MFAPLHTSYCTITLGGALLGSVASLEERGRSGYMAVVRGLLDALAIMPGESVLEVGCGSGVIMRELARRTGGANRLIGRDIKSAASAGISGSHCPGDRSSGSSTSGTPAPRTR